MLLQCLGSYGDLEDDNCNKAAAQKVIMRINPYMLTHGGWWGKEKVAGKK